MPRTPAAFSLSNLPARSTLPPAARPGQTPGISGALSIQGVCDAPETARAPPGAPGVEEGCDTGLMADATHAPNASRANVSRQIPRITSCVEQSGRARCNLARTSSPCSRPPPPNQLPPPLMGSMGEEGESCRRRGRHERPLPLSKARHGGRSEVRRAARGDIGASPLLDASMLWESQ